MTDGQECFIGIDVGTQSTKAILFIPNGSKIGARSSHTHTLHQDPSRGRAEQHPRIWVEALKHCFTELSQVICDKNFKVSGIGVSGQQHGMVILDENHNVIRDAKLWCDVEASVESEEFSQMANDNMKDTEHDFKPGCWGVPAGFTAPKVLWVKKNEPDNFARMKYCVLPHDYITFLLRGGGGEIDGVTLLTDAGDASGTGFFNPMTRDYDENLTRCIADDFRECLAEIPKDPNAVAGYLSPRWKSLLGIEGQEEDVVISLGSGDNMCSALGCGCVEPGTAVLSLGTSGTIFGVSREPINAMSSVAPFCDATGHYLPLACVMSCTLVLQSVLDQCDDLNSHDEAVKRAMICPPGCHGLFFLPYLCGERTPNWPHAFGALMGLSLDNINVFKDSGLLYRVVLEGLSYNLKYSLKEVTKVCPDFDPSVLLVVGGGSRNQLWRQILATILELELRFPLEAESAALGAAFQAEVATKRYCWTDYIKTKDIEIEEESIKPVEEHLSVYRQGYERFCEHAKNAFL